MFVHTTLTTLKRHFWWPTMDADASEVVSACSVCARGKASHQPPSGQLQPVPALSRPWSHIALDFVADLPPSLVALPTAAEMAEQLEHHVFRLHRIPSDAVSNRGPQFTSQVWKAFCPAIGASVRLGM